MGGQGVASFENGLGLEGTGSSQSLLELRQQEARWMGTQSSSWATCLQSVHTRPAHRAPRHDIKHRNSVRKNLADCTQIHGNEVTGEGHRAHSSSRDLLKRQLICSIIFQLYKGGPPKTCNYHLEGRPLVVQASPIRRVF